MPPPLISICLPNLNHRRFLEERMETILAQTVTDWELIICDRYSNDGSWEFFQKFKGDPRIRMYQVPREGLYAGWNECLRRATGEYIYIATSDDTMLPECLERLVTPLERMPALHIAVCDFQEIDDRSQPLVRSMRPQQEFLRQWIHTASIRNGKTEFLLHAAFGTTIWTTMTTVLFRRSLLERTGYFRTDLGSHADEEWALRASLASDIAVVPGKLATWRIHPAQATQPTDDASRIVLDCIVTVLNDKCSGIPQEWKKVPEWQRELTAMHVQAFKHSFQLFRWKAKQNPSRFLKDYVNAWRWIPSWAWRQSLNGFTWKDEWDLQPAVHFHHLVALFHANWPPENLANPAGDVT